MITQCQRSISGFPCTERSSYMNMFLWLLDFVTPSNNFYPSFSILVYNNTITSLRLIVYYLIIANSRLRPSFTIYQTIYDSPSRDNYKISQPRNSSLWLKQCLDQRKLKGDAIILTSKMDFNVNQYKRPLTFSTWYEYDYAYHKRLTKSSVQEKLDFMIRKRHNRRFCELCGCHCFCPFSPIFQQSNHFLICSYNWSPCFFF